VNATAKLLNASEAAAQLGISAKALRIYEERGLLAPARTAAGWRAYDNTHMTRAAEIVALRALGLSLGEIGKVLSGDAGVLPRALADHEATLETRLRELMATVDKVRRLRADLMHGKRPIISEIAAAVRPHPPLGIAFDLPWPWGGEAFALHDIKAINFIVGPLGSGKTRLAMRIAEALPNGHFIGLERFAEKGAAAARIRDGDPALGSRVEEALATIIEAGGTRSDALLASLTALEAQPIANIVIDTPEQGLDGATQEALMSYLRRRASKGGVIFLVARSDAMLDLECARIDEAIILCPANHSPPFLVAPYPGSPGYEAVATCLASPEVRARTEGVIAWRPATSLVDAAAIARSVREGR